MEIDFTEKTVVHLYACIGDCEVEFDRLWKLTEKLAICDGLTKSLAIPDEDLEACMLALGIIKLTPRGGWYPGKNFESFYLTLKNKRHDRNNRDNC